MLGVWSRKWAGGVGVLGGVEISLVSNVLVAAVNQSINQSINQFIR